MTKDEARKELLETLEEYCHDKGYNLAAFAGLADLVYTLYPLQKYMTNADKLRSMTDEQLAEWLEVFSYEFSECRCCGLKIKSGSNCENSCSDGLLKWLKQEHKENSND
jgi:hypothetical protein